MKYLSIPKDNYTIETIDDIGEVSSSDPPSSDACQLQNTSVTGVLHLEAYKQCDMQL